jgi:hypothetical protein
MADNIEIPFEVIGQAELVKAMEAAAKASEKAADALDKQGKAAKFALGPNQKLILLQEQLVRAQTAKNTAAMKDIQLASARAQKQLMPKPGPKPPKAPKTPALPEGPRQRLAKLQQEHARAIAAGNEDAQEDISHKIKTAKRQIEREDDSGKRRGTDKKLETFIRSMRFGKDGAMPLVGQGLDLLGLGELAGPIGVMAAAATLAAEGLKAFGDIAVSTGNRMAEMQVKTGSSSADNAALMNLGFSGDAAQAFNDRISSGSDSSAMAVAAKYNVSNAPGMFGQQDYGKELLDVTKKIYNSNESQVDKLREFRALGINPDVLNLSKNTFNRDAGADANQAGSIFSPEYAQQTTEFTESLKRMTQVIENVAGFLAGPVINDITKPVNQLNAIFSGQMSWKEFWTGAGENQYGVSGGDQSTKDKNTNALNKNTEALGISQRQYGHGERTDAALPRGSGMGSGMAVRQNLEAGAFRLGAFG